MALLASGLVLGVGAGATTLAAWTDQESVWGGTGDTATVPGGPGGGLSSSLFNMQQSTDGGAHWVDGNPSGQLAFSAGASSLSPGTTTYAYVLLRTVERSAAGTVTLEGADLMTGSDSGLAGALRYGARVGMAVADCAASSYAGAGSQLVPLNTPLTTGSAPTTFRLGAGSVNATGPEKGVCFAVSLPSGVSNTVSGKSVTPVWRFDAISD